MNPSQHMTTLRQTHRTATAFLPVITATLTVAGAVLATMEARASNSATASGAEGQAGGPLAATPAMSAYTRRVTARSYIATLAGRLLLVALGVALVLALVYLATTTGRTGLAIILTTLILLTLYLTEKAARR